LGSRIFRTLLLLLSVLPAFAVSAVAESTLKVVDGRVKEVWLDRQEFTLSYRHPVSGEMEELVIKVDGGTGFSEGVRLEDFRGGDPVSVDYQEGPEGEARAVQVKRVPLRGVPIDKGPGF
jgi:hypothetical protein